MARLDDDSDISNQHWIDSFNTQPRQSPAVAQWDGGTVPAPAQMSQPWANVYTQYAPPVAYTQQAAQQQSYAPSYQDTTAQQSAPAKPKIDYNSADYLNGSKDSELDGTFNDQKALYSDKLKRYIADYDAQTGGTPWGQNAAKFDLSQLGGSMGVDYNNSKQGIDRNRNMGLKNLAEDFANRGMIYSGLYNQDYGLAQGQYDRQGQNLDQGVHNQLQTLNFNRGNQETDTTAQIAAARRDALNRLSQAQSLT